MIFVPICLGFLGSRESAPWSATTRPSRATTASGPVCSFAVPIAGRICHRARSVRALSICRATPVVLNRYRAISTVTL
jgi:hypothetical protein